MSYSEDRADSRSMMSVVIVCLVVVAVGVVVYFAVWAPAQNNPSTVIVQPSAPGPAGAAGATGATGAEGAAGTQGNQGVQGDQGSQGTKGDAGSQADPGGKANQGGGTIIDPEATPGR